MTGIDTELREAVRAPGILGGRERIRPIEVFDFSGDLGVEKGGIELSDPIDATFARQKICPKRIDVVAQRTDDTQTGDDDPSICPIASHKNKGAAWAHVHQSCPLRVSTPTWRGFRRCT